MKLPPLIEGRLIRRYKRFLADVELCDGRIVTAHTPNTGRMQGLTDPGNRVWLRDSGNSKRKYRLSWVLVETAAGVMVGIDTGLANGLVAEAIETGRIATLQGYETMRREVRYGSEGSRVDLLLEDPRLGRCWIEVKNVTLVEDGTAFFPDAVTERGRKHLRELAGCAERGDRAVLTLCVQRADAFRFRPADHIDPSYGSTLREVAARGVEVIAWRANVDTHCIELVAELPVEL